MNFLLQLFKAEHKAGAFGKKKKYASNLLQWGRVVGCYIDTISPVSQQNEQDFLYIGIAYILLSL